MAIPDRGMVLMSGWTTEALPASPTGVLAIGLERTCPKGMSPMGSVCKVATQDNERDMNVQH
jgi:hypothetical protein